MVKQYKILVRHLCMSFGMITLSLSMEIKQDYAIWILIALLQMIALFQYDVERWFDTSNYDKNDKRPLPIGINKKVIGKFNDELDGKIMTQFFALRPKAYAYKLDDDDTEMKKAKGTKKCIVKRELTFKNYVDALFNDEIIIISQQRFRSDHRKISTEEVDKITLSSNDDIRIQTFDKVTTYPYGTNALKVCENEMKYVILKNKLQAPGNDSQIL